MGTRRKDFRRRLGDLRSGDEHGARGVGDDGLGDGAEEPTTGGALAVRPDDDEVGLEIGSELEDLLPDPAEGHVPGDSPAESLGDLGRYAVDERSRLLKPLALCRGRLDGRMWFDDVEEMELRTT
jgi:hypothetical protein